MITAAWGGFQNNAQCLDAIDEGIVAEGFKQVKWMFRVNPLKRPLFSLVALEVAVAPAESTETNKLMIIQTQPAFRY